jgi:hypothetical protein
MQTQKSFLKAEQISGREITADVDVLRYISAAVCHPCKTAHDYEINAGLNKPFEQV